MKKIEPAPAFNLWDKDNPEETFKLLKLIGNPDCKKLFEKYNKDYLYWDKIKYETITKGLSKEEFWKALSFKREVASIPVKFSTYAFKYVRTNHISKRLHEFDMAFGGNINFQGTPEFDKRQYLISSLMEEAIASSQIEGAVTTRKKAKEMLRKSTPPRSLSDQMILNNYQSIIKLSTLKGQKMTPVLLLGIHKSITESTLDNREDEGRFRTTDDISVVDILDSEVVYTPPSHTEISALISSLCTYFNNDDEEQFTHPIIKGCIIHFMIGWIHPFADGNGRTARALFYLYMLNKGYWLIEYMSISRLIFKSKVQYANAYLYTETDRNDLTYFINYKIRMLHLAFESLETYIRKKVKAKAQFKLISRIGHINERQAELIRLLHENNDRLLSVKELITIFSVADQTIRNDLKELLEKGIVAEIPLNNKASVYGIGKKYDDFIKSAFKVK